MGKHEPINGQRKDKMKYVKLEEIVVAERYREDLGDIEELVESIKEKGVIQPITVDSTMRLLAGGRRYEASKQAGIPTIPVIIRDFVDEVDSREIELFENIHRKDFTWTEEAKLTKAIDDLYKAKYGRSWSGRKTAELLDQSKSAVARNLQLANAIEFIPEIGEQRTADDALKMLKKLEEAQITAELRSRQQARIDASGVANPAVVANAREKGIRDTLRLAHDNYMVIDVFKGMADLKTGGRIEMIECDPPYGIRLNEQKASSRAVDSTVKSYEEIEGEKYPAFLKKLTEELYRVAGKDCWLVFWFGPSWHSETLNALRAAGWHVDEIPAIWVKAHGQTLQPEIYLARSYEPFFLCRKGKPILAERGRVNVFQFPGIPGKQKYHPTQRPVELIKELFTTLAVGQPHVFIPFLGSGASLLACYDLGLRGFGFDLNGEYKDKFMLEAEHRARKLFDPEQEG